MNKNAHVSNIEFVLTCSTATRTCGQCWRQCSAFGVRHFHCKDHFFFQTLLANPFVETLMMVVIMIMLKSLKYEKRVQLVLGKLWKCLCLFIVVVFSPESMVSALYVLTNTQTGINWLSAGFSLCGASSLIIGPCHARTFPFTIWPSAHQWDNRVPCNSRYFGAIENNCRLTTGIILAFSLLISIFIAHKVFRRLCFSA